MVLYLNIHELHSPKDALCQIWLKLAQWFLRRIFKDFVNVFSLFRNYLPLEKGGALRLNKFEYPSPKDAFCRVKFKLTQWFLRGFFFYFVNVFSLFRSYLLLKEGGPFMWAKLNPFHPRMLIAKFGWNWRSGSGEEDGNLKSLW